MYFGECEVCGASLDPGEKCTCWIERKEYTALVERITYVDDSGQLRLEVENVL